MSQQPDEYTPHGCRLQQSLVYVTHGEHAAGAQHVLHELHGLHELYVTYVHAEQPQP